MRKLLLLIIPLLFSCNKNNKKIKELEEKIIDLEKVVSLQRSEGHESVVFYTLGDKLDKSDVKIQEDVMKMEVLSENGLIIKLELSYRYQPLPGNTKYIEEDIGNNYHENIIRPEIKSVTREVFGEYLPEELYSTKRETVEDEIYEKAKISLAKKSVLLDAVLLRNITLPKTLQDAIENKLKQEQMSLEYEFKIEQAEKEAQRALELEFKNLQKGKTVDTTSLIPSSCVEGDCENGYGTYISANGYKYVGEWKSGKEHGQGTGTSADGRKYMGEWKNGKQHGQGTYTIVNVYEYIGEWKDNKKSGWGTITYADGGKYVGEWKNDKEHGQGTLTLARGDKYVGEFKDSYMHGQGALTDDIGIKYVGEFKHDLPHGQGTVTYTDGEKKSGLWENGKFLGE